MSRRQSRAMVTDGSTVRRSPHSPLSSHAASPSLSTGLNPSMLPKSGSPEASVEEALAMPHEARCLRG